MLRIPSAPWYQRLLLLSFLSPTLSPTQSKVHSLSMCLERTSQNWALGDRRCLDVEENIVMYSQWCAARVGSCDVYGSRDCVHWRVVVVGTAGWRKRVLMHMPPDGIMLVRLPFNWRTSPTSITASPHLLALSIKGFISNWGRTSCVFDEQEAKLCRCLGGWFRCLAQPSDIRHGHRSRRQWSRVDLGQRTNDPDMFYGCN